jgi:hypothetical protein
VKPRGFTRRITRIFSTSTSASGCQVRQEGSWQIWACERSPSSSASGRRQGSDYLRSHRSGVALRRARPDPDRPRVTVVIENEITYLSVDVLTTTSSWGKGFEVDQVGRLPWLVDA